MFDWLDRVPLLLLAVAAILFALAPFTPEPHLWQKAKMLMDGTLTHPADIFDVFFHAAPLMLLFIKIARMRPGSDNLSPDDTPPSSPA